MSETSQILNISSKYYKKILGILSASDAESRLVGGCVRDALLGRENFDIDIATVLTPYNVIRTLKAAEIKTLPTGIKFGTVSAFLKDEKFEITTLRRDLNCSGRHAKVEFTNDFEVDAKRRDFTINALSYCPFKNILYDYFEGAKDLEAAKVRFIGDAEARIKEDYLRILRFFRFSCYYAKHLDSVGYEACARLQAGLEALSGERIKWEMDKIIVSDNSPLILNRMFESGILNTLFRIELFDHKILTHAINLAKKSNSIFSAAARYAILFLGLENLEYKNLINFKFDRASAWKILEIQNSLEQFTEDRKHVILRRIWLDQKEDFADFVLALAAIGKIDERFATQFILEHQYKKRPVFIIDGHDLYKLGFREREIKDNLNFLKDRWIESNYTLTKADLLPYS
jgi:poly(A) polymerase